VYGGAAGSTTNVKEYLHKYKRLTSRKVFYDAGKRAHASVGQGYVKLVCGSNVASASTHIYIHCFHTTSLPVTVLSPGLFVICQCKIYEACIIYANHRMKRGYTRIHATGNNQDLYIPGILRGALMYSCALYSPSMVSGINALPEPEENAVANLSTTAKKVILHQRLGHIHHHKLFELHKHAKGVPKITISSDVDS
jgi:hypothetical protein